MFKQLTVYRGIQLLVCAVVAASLSACGGGGSPGASPTVAVIAEKDLAASQSGQLLNYVQGKLKEQVKANASGSTAYVSGGPIAALALASPSATASSTKDNATAGFSLSTLQEVGVDEDDLMKTDGTMVYGMTAAGVNTPARLIAYQRTAAGTVAKTASVDLQATTQRTGFYLLSQAKKIATIGSTTEAVPFAVIENAPSGSGAAIGSASASNLASPPPVSGLLGYQRVQWRNKVDISLIDTSNIGSLPINKTLSIDGTLIGSRVIGNVLYLATSFAPPVEFTNTAIDALKLSDILPTIRVDSNPATPLLSDTECFLQVKNASNSANITTITAIDLASTTLARNSRCFVGGSEAIYVSEKSVYVATTRYSYAVPATVSGASTVVSPMWSYPADIKTDIHKFSIDGLSVSYRATAEVKGHLGWDQEKKQYRMSEYGADLRVITFTGELGWNFVPTIDPSASQAGNTAPSPATLTILRDSGAELKAISTLPNTKRPQPIGLPNEQIYAVRFLGDKGFVVTFRRTDPLYTLDLSDPTDPKVAGELKTPGFSNYLFPVGSNLLLGVGQDATATGFTQGIKIGLIDISDLANPKEIATRLIGNRGSVSALDASAHGINLYTVNGVTRIALPIRVHETPESYSAVQFAPTYQSLFRFEVNAAAKTLTDKAPISGLPLNAVNGWNTPALYDVLYVGNSRSVQIANEVYFLNGGLITGSIW
jgi:Beta propeller domain